MHEVSNKVSSGPLHLLVVSRQPSSLGPLWSVAETNGWRLEIAASGCEALERVQFASPDLVLLDADEGDADGLYTLRCLRRVRPELLIVLLARTENPQQKLEALRLGAQEYLLKPVEAKQLEPLMERASGLENAFAPDGDGDGAASRNEMANAESVGISVEELTDGMLFVAASPAMHKLRAQAELLAQVDVPLLITGESGAGKETAARLIHKLSARAGFGFHHLNCAAAGGDLLERELLGYEPGAFPGALRSRPGKLELAERGTLLLHDITATSLPLQAKLLQILQDKQFVRLGGENGIAADMRIVASTSENPERAMAGKRLREDLYYRLSAFTLQVPSLRQRRTEIPLLLEHFMKQWALHYGLPPRRFSRDWAEACQAHDWPGNLRELESVVKRYLVMGDEELVLGELRRSRETASSGSAPAAGGAENGAANDAENTTETGAGNGGSRGHGWAREIHVHAMQPPAPAEPGRAKEASPKEGSLNDTFKEPSGLRSLVESVKGTAELNAIRVALERTRWNRKAAARLLKVSYRTLLYKIQQYRMTPPGVFSAASPSSGAAVRELPVPNFKRNDFKRDDFKQDDFKQNQES